MELSYSTYRVEICPLESVRFPRFVGAALRGAFGYAFKSITCAHKYPHPPFHKGGCGGISNPPSSPFFKGGFSNMPCSACSLKHLCIYKRIFEAEVKKSDIKFLTGFERPPRSFVVRPVFSKKNFFNRNEPILFELVLIGWAQDCLPLFSSAFQKMCKSGLGAKKAECELKEVIGLRQQSIGCKFPMSRARIKFLSPFRFKRAGKFSADLDFSKLAAQLLKRISLLGHFYQDGAIPKRELYALLKISKNVKTVESRLKWCELERYSTRQKSKQKFGGVIGHITFEGDLTPFSPYLVAGEELHVGKQTTFGLGQYRLDILVE